MELTIKNIPKIDNKIIIGYSNLSNLFSTIKFLDELRDRFEPLFKGEFETNIEPDEWNWKSGKDPEDATRQICNAWKSDNLIRDLVRTNRAKHDLYLFCDGDTDQNTVVRQAVKNWFNPTGHGANKAWLARQKDGSGADAGGGGGRGCLLYTSDAADE